MDVKRLGALIIWTASHLPKPGKRISNLDKVNYCKSPVSGCHPSSTNGIWVTFVPISHGDPRLSGPSPSTPAFNQRLTDLKTDDQTFGEFSSINGHSARSSIVHVFSPGSIDLPALIRLEHHPPPDSKVLQHPIVFARIQYH